MTELPVNDLIGMPYRWGASPEDGSGYTDCWQLVCCVRRRLGLPDHASQFDWAYETYTEGSLMLSIILRWLHKYATQVEAPRAGTIVCMRTVDNVAALGTAISENKVIFIGGAKRVVTAPCSLIESPRFFDA